MTNAGTAPLASQRCGAVAGMTRELVRPQFVRGTNSHDHIVGRRGASIVCNLLDEKQRATHRVALRIAAVSMAGGEPKHLTETADRSEFITEVSPDGTTVVVEKGRGSSKQPRPKSIPKGWRRVDKKELSSRRSRAAGEEG